LLRARVIKPERSCQHVLGRYRITVRLIPDGKAHTIARVFESDCSYERITESGERLESQSFYDDRSLKISVGYEYEAGYTDRARFTDKYDYDADYPENVMSFLIGTNTKTERFTFGIALIDYVRRDDPNDENNSRDVETWYGTTPTSAL
ncbi:MAG: hypothetical protein K6D94_12860, partial [Clostridiales bacterium]|nr:hypothetical protein [Clostridiales bacterium]